MKNLLSKVLRKLRKKDRVKFRLYGNKYLYWISRSFQWGAFEFLEVEPMGLFRVHGWFRNQEQSLKNCRLLIDGKEIPLVYQYRTHRADRAELLGLSNMFCGFVLEYLFEPPNPYDISQINIEFKNEKIFELVEKMKISIPPANHLFCNNRVLHREDIYGFGPPSQIVSLEVLDLAKTLTPPILDFGCGIGALIKELRVRKLETFGIEVERAPIIEGIIKEAESYIKLYDGRLPLPYEDNSFESCISSEVLEHIPDYEATIKELSRVTRNRLIVTVPDISSIPVSYQHQVIPWHLLESTHVNFFTQNSLFQELNKFFKKIEFGRIGQIMINGTRYYTNLVAIADK